MFRGLRFPATLLTLVLLVGVLVAFTPGKGPEAKATLGPVQVVTVGPADFHPSDDSVVFTLGNDHVEAGGSMVARIPFPAETVLLTRTEFRVYDNEAAGFVCVGVVRSRPRDRASDPVGGECTVVTSATDPQVLDVAPFTRIGRFHSAILRVDFSTDSPDLKLYGATVFYRVVS